MPRRTTWIFLLLLTLLTACARPTPAPLPPAEIIERVVTRMTALKGFAFVIVRSGAPAYLDAAQTFSLSRLEGSFTAPDRAQGKARVIGPGIVAAIQFISIAQNYWETHYLTGEWWQCPLNQCFNPALLFDPQAGLQPILKSDLTDLQRLANGELEELPGKELYVLSATLKADHIYPLSWNMIGPDSLRATLWIDPTTFDLHRIRLEEPAANGAEATLWTVDFLKFDQPTAIQAPAAPRP